MEVHHHPHVEKKNLKEYLLEGLMIFVAVTMGFIAENIRESISEHRTGKEYIQSYTEDLEQDSITLTKGLNYTVRLTKYLDSAIILLEQPDLKQNGADRYYYARWATRSQNISFANRAIVGLMNAGGFRLINHAAADSILKFQSLIDGINSIQQTELDESKQLYPYITKVFDGRVFVATSDSLNRILKPDHNCLLKSEDSGAISDLIFFLYQRKASLIVESLRIKQMLRSASSIKTFLHDQNR